MTHVYRFTQRGVSLLFSLVTLVALSLAAVALIRSVDSGVLILGNLGFKQDTQFAADDASRAAIAWLSNNMAGGVLNNDVTAQGYYASTRTPLDPSGNKLAALGNTRTLIDWDGNSCASATSASYAACITPSSENTVALARANVEGVKARYAIFRLCSGTGDPNASGATIQCAKPLTATTDEGTERGSLNYSKSERFGAAGLPQYFRIIVRAKGQRETVTYTETLVHF